MLLDCRWLCEGLTVGYLATVQRMGMYGQCRVPLCSSNGATIANLSLNWDQRNTGVPQSPFNWFHSQSKICHFKPRPSLHLQDMGVWMQFCVFEVLLEIFFSACTQTKAYQRAHPRAVICFGHDEHGSGGEARPRLTCTLEAKSAQFCVLFVHSEPDSNLKQLSVCFFMVLQ